MNREDKGGAGRGKSTAHGPLPSILAFGDGPHPDIKASREGLRKMPSQFQAKTKLIVHPGTSGGLSPAPLAAACLLFTALEAGRGARVSGCSSHRRAEGRWQGRSQKTASNLGASPGSTRRLSTSLRREDKRNREVWPPESQSESARPPLGGSRAWVPGDSASGAAVRTRRWLCSPTGTACLGAWAWAVRECRAREGAREHSRGAAGKAGAQVSAGSPAPRRSGLTPPPARPGSGDSSRRALRAGRGRGRGRRRRRPPGRRGRRRTSGNP